MQEHDEDQINTEENDLQQNYQNTYQNNQPIPQYDSRPNLSTDNSSPNIAPQNIAPQNVPPQNVPPQNVPPQNVPPQNIGAQNMAQNMALHLIQQPLAAQGVVLQYNIPQGIPQYYPPQNAPISQPVNTPVQSQINQPLINQITYSSQSNQIYQSDQVNQSYQNKSKSGIPSEWEILSFLGWFLFMGSKWDMYEKVKGISHDDYAPILYNRSFIGMITLIISIIGFLVYVKNIIYKRNINFYHSFFGQYTKFHSIPLFMYTGINIVLDKYIIDKMTEVNKFTTVKGLSHNDSFDIKAVCAFYIIFSICGLASLIYIYINLEMDCEWYIAMIIKKGVFSILTAECSYHFFESIFYTRLINIDIEKNIDDIESLYHTGGIFFSILQAVFVIGFAVYYKNIILLALNFLMFYSMIMNYYVKKEDEDNVLWKNDATAGLEITVIVINFALMIFMVAKYKEQLIEP
jgi:hypothetical protein